MLFTKHELLFPGYFLFWNEAPPYKTPVVEESSRVSAGGRTMPALEHQVGQAPRRTLSGAAVTAMQLKPFLPLGLF